MAYSAQYQTFSTDRQGFFSDVNTTDTTRTRVAAVTARANEKNYCFLADNRQLIMDEFNQMFAILENQGRERQEFWLYCYYCSLMLKNYYAAYDKKDQAEKYSIQSEQLKYRCLNGSFEDPAVNNDTFLQSFRKKIASDLGSLASTPFHTSKIRDWLAFSNIQRIDFVFNRIFVKQSLFLLAEWNWLANIDGMVGIINAPAPVFNVLSVGLFAARFIINTGMVLKHTFAPSEDDGTITTLQRFKNEIYDRHRVMLNDFVWGSVNLLTNYAVFFNISAPVANWVTVGFLVFDVSLLIYSRKFLENEYLIKRAQYFASKKECLELMSSAITIEEKNRYQAHCEMLDKQLAQLEINWDTTSATYLFNVGGAALLFGGFSAALLLAGSTAAAVCFLVCTIGVAMYLTADIYGKYHEKSMILQQQELHGQNTEIALKDMHTARNNFLLAMIKNIAMPLLIVTTFAVCWEAALLLTVGYVCYEYLHGCIDKRKGGNNAALPRSAVAASDVASNDDEEASSLLLSGL